MALSLDRRSFIDVLSGGQGDIGAAMLAGVSHWLERMTRHQSYGKRPVSA
jgi:hypothetical protein